EVAQQRVATQRPGGDVDARSRVDGGRDDHRPDAQAGDGQLDVAGEIDGGQIRLDHAVRAAVVDLDVPVTAGAGDGRDLREAVAGEVAGRHAHAAEEVVVGDERQQLGAGPATDRLDVRRAALQADDDVLVAVVVQVGGGDVQTGGVVAEGHEGTDLDAGDA